jgi:hypothetical protein
VVFTVTPAPLTFTVEAFVKAVPVKVSVVVVPINPDGALIEVNEDGGTAIKLAEPETAPVAAAVIVADTAPAPE